MLGGLCGLGLETGLLTNHSFWGTPHHIYLRSTEIFCGLGHFSRLYVSDKNCSLDVTITFDNCVVKLKSSFTQY